MSRQRTSSLSSPATIKAAHDVLDGAGVNFLDGSHPRLVERIKILCNQRADLLTACEVLVDEHHLFARDDWQCPFCARTADSAFDFPHADDCPVVKARAAIAKVKEK